LFADAANVPDIFANQTVIIAHEDGDAEASHLLLQHATSHANQLAPVSTGKSVTRVMYDEDSPSLQAGSAVAVVSICALSNESVTELLDPLVVEELYLRNSSLLI
jgi:hypothetical protein